MKQAFEFSKPKPISEVEVVRPGGAKPPMNTALINAVKELMPGQVIVCSVGAKDNVKKKQCALRSLLQYYKLDRVNGGRLSVRLTTDHSLAIMCIAEPQKLSSAGANPEQQA